MKQVRIQWASNLLPQEIQKNIELVHAPQKSFIRRQHLSPNICNPSISHPFNRLKHSIIKVLGNKWAVCLAKSMYFTVRIRKFNLIGHQFLVFQMSISKALCLEDWIKFSQWHEISCFNLYMNRMNWSGGSRLRSCSCSNNSSSFFSNKIRCNFITQVAWWSPDPWDNQLVGIWWAFIRVKWVNNFKVSSLTSEWTQVAFSKINLTLINLNKYFLDSYLAQSLISQIKDLSNIKVSPRLG